MATKFDITVLLNEFKAAIQEMKGNSIQNRDKVNYSPVTLSSYDGKKMDKITYDEPAQWVEAPTFQELLNGMSNLQFADDKESYAEKIRKTSAFLSDKQIKLLLTNLWNKQ